MSEYTEVLPDANDLLAGSSVPSLSFKDLAVGDSYEGVITGLRTVQVRNYEDPTKLEFWDDGKPKLQIEVTLSTGYADPTNPDDEGSRRAFLFGQKLRAAQDEMRKKGLKKLEIGSQFIITLTGTKPSQNKRYNDVKLYGIEINAAKSDSAADALLSAGATPVAKKDGKMAKLDAKQTKVAETLQSNGFTAEEIAENLGVDVAIVDASLTF
jgi:hypothetical protein|tara:strand:+ start:229 stop:861 length:633 start_codon:yes stop_codon:yes gene_type:complete